MAAGHSGARLPLPAYFETSTPLRAGSSSSSAAAAAVAHIARRRELASAAPSDAFFIDDGTSLDRAAWRRRSASLRTQLREGVEWLEQLRIKEQSSKDTVQELEAAYLRSLKRRERERRGAYEAREDDSAQRPHRAAVAIQRLFREKQEREVNDERGWRAGERREARRASLAKVEAEIEQLRMELTVALASDFSSHEAPAAAAAPAMAPATGISSGRGSLGGRTPLLRTGGSQRSCTPPSPGPGPGLRGPVGCASGPQSEGSDGEGRESELETPGGGGRHGHLSDRHRAALARLARRFRQRRRPEPGGEREPCGRAGEGADAGGGAGRHRGPDVDPGDAATLIQRAFRRYRRRRRWRRVCRAVLVAQEILRQAEERMRRMGRLQRAATLLQKRYRLRRAGEARAAAGEPRPPGAREGVGASQEEQERAAQRLQFFFRARRLYTQVTARRRRPGPAFRTPSPSRLAAAGLGAAAAAGLGLAPSEARLLSPDPSFFLPLRSPGAADWLAQREERGQTFEQFVLEPHRNRVTAERSVLYLAPACDGRPAEGPSVDLLSDFVSCYFAGVLPVRILPPAPGGPYPAPRRRLHPHTGRPQAPALSPLPPHLRGALTRIRTQVRALDLLSALRDLLPPDVRARTPEIAAGYTLTPAKGFCVIGTTGEDLYLRSDADFVFGSASLRDRVGVCSFARLRGPARGARCPLSGGDTPAPSASEAESESGAGTATGTTETEGVRGRTASCSGSEAGTGGASGSEGGEGGALLLRRVLKVTAHEVGHMFGLRHCVFYRCAMNGSSGLSEGDRRPLEPCPVCLAKLSHAASFRARERYGRMLEFYRRVGFESEARWVATRLASSEAPAPALL